jgi:ABC-type molybdate transport system substrate-binding protein
MKRRGVKIVSFLVSLFGLLTLLSAEVCAEELIVFCGGAFKKPLDEIIQQYDKAKVSANYGAFYTLLSQLSLGKHGDVFFVPSPDIMELGVKKGLVKKESVKNFLYLVPVIVVKKGNPKKNPWLKRHLKT